MPQLKEYPDTKNILQAQHARIQTVTPCALGSCLTRPPLFPVLRCYSKLSTNLILITLFKYRQNFVLQSLVYRRSRSVIRKAINIHSNSWESEPLRLVKDS